MGNSALVLFLIAATSTGSPIPRAEVETQNEVFQRLWNDDFNWTFDELPEKGGVPKRRVPYSGYIYLDKHGGTTQVLRKYDRAVNNNYSYPATSWEYGDTSEARSRSGRRLFRSLRSSRSDWYGHCNGWCSAAIRHVEPQKPVTVNGVTFTPADIKGLLAEVYMYNQHEMLAGFESNLNPGSLHAILANWLGRGSHAVVMDSDPTKEKWNYPIYSFSSSHIRHSGNEVEVRTNIYYAKDTEDHEHMKSPRIRKMKKFHYMLTLNNNGDITGGYYFRDSTNIDFLWVPISPKASGEAGNEAGNPHLNVTKILDIWRKSVPRQQRRQWLIVDPAENDRAQVIADPNRLLPRRIKIVPGEITLDTEESEEPVESEARVDTEDAR